MKKYTVVSLCVFSLCTEASVLEASFNSSSWTLETYEHPLYKFMMKQIYKRAKQNTLDQDANHWALDNPWLESYYSVHGIGLSDRSSCQSKKYNNRPVWIDGAYPPIRYDGDIPVYRLAAGYPYQLAQMDLSKRGDERVRKHYYSWFVENKDIIHNENEGDRYLQYSFYKNTQVYSMLMATEWQAAISWGGKWNESGGTIDGSTKFKFSFGDGQFLERESCNIYKVEITPNTAPDIELNFTYSVINPQSNRYGMGLDISARDQESTFPLVINTIIEKKDGTQIHSTPSTTQLNGSTRSAVSGILLTTDQCGAASKKLIKSITIIASDSMSSKVKTITEADIRQAALTYCP